MAVLNVNPDAVAALERMAGVSAPAIKAGPQLREISNADNRRMLRGRFDLQFTTSENEKRWGLADGLSIDAGASWMVRRILRQRSRYEYHNNGYYQGIVDTIANYAVGVGPRLQCLTDNKDFNRELEEDFEAWAQEINLRTTLKSMRAAQIYNGEAFALLRSNPNLDHEVKLDVFEIEADQVSSPMFGFYPAQYPDQFFDGVILDPWGRPETYQVLRQHPGAFGAFVIMGYEFDNWPAKSVLHAYKHIRPGQQRGVPEMLPALQLFTEIRAFSAAVRAGAETAADIAAYIESQAPAIEDEDKLAVDFIPIERRQIMTLPFGYKISQLKAEQPTTMLKEFVDVNLREACRVTNLPLFMASMDATGLNMSVAYVLTQPFKKSIESDRADYDRLNDRILASFIEEWKLVKGYPDGSLPPRIKHEWRWPDITQHADPSKVAAAEAQEIENGSTSIPQLCARKGLDWEDVQESQAKALGISVEELRKKMVEKMFAPKGIGAPGMDGADGGKGKKGDVEEGDEEGAPVGADEEGEA